jgi:hypothetical protein
MRKGRWILRKQKFGAGEKAQKVEKRRKKAQKVEKSRKKLQEVERKSTKGGLKLEKGEVRSASKPRGRGCGSADFADFAERRIKEWRHGGTPNEQGSS